jgi:cytochrome o ubiquinol oxidase subunit 2
MLIVVVPVILLTLYFAWRYRASNRNATYAPNWSHSTAIEVVIWTVPTLIILFLGVLTWKTTHELDPYKPLESAVKPIDVEVVALDWKWLFIYPELGIASVNQLAIPVGTPVNFRITSDSVMNSFFIPQLGGQVYAMAGMQTRLHLIADEAGDYAGVSANSAPRLLRSSARSPSRASSSTRGCRMKASADRLDATAYGTVAQPSEKAPVRYFSSVDPKLFHNIIAKYNNGHVLDRRTPPARTKGNACWQTHTIGDPVRSAHHHGRRRRSWARRAGHSRRPHDHRPWKWLWTSG